jgi:hypothetical protein
MQNSSEVRKQGVACRTQNSKENPLWGKGRSDVHSFKDPLNQRRLNKTTLMMYGGRTIVHSFKELLKQRRSNETTSLYWGRSSIHSFKELLWSVGATTSLRCWGYKYTFSWSFQATESRGSLYTLRRHPSQQGAKLIIQRQLEHTIREWLVLD